MQLLAQASGLQILGNSDMALSPLGLGAWGFGGSGWPFSLGPQNDRESIATIHCALDYGINWIDTAPLYGFGHSDQVVSRALHSSPHAPYIFTKCSTLWRENGEIYNSLRPASIRYEIELSLRRLGVDAIDLCQVHWPEPDDEIEEGWETLALLQEQGKIRWLGVCNFSIEQMKRAMRIAPITSLQPNYSVLCRKGESEELAFAQNNQIGVINYGAMGSGLLTGHFDSDTLSSLAPDDYRRRMRQFQSPWLKRNKPLVDLLREIGAAHGVSPGVIAVAWTLHHPFITGTIVGCRSVEEVEAIAPAMHFRLTDDEHGQIQKLVTSAEWFFRSARARLQELLVIPRN